MFIQSAVRKINHRKKKKASRGLPLAWSTFGLSALASFGILLLRLQGSTAQTWLILEWIAIAILAVFLRTRSLQRAPWLMITIGALSLLPVVDHLVQRFALGWTGEATELIWIAIIQYAAFLTAATAASNREHWIVMLLSSAMLLFGLASSDRREIGFLAGVYGILAAWWLMDIHWKSLEKGFVHKESAPLWRLRLIALTVLASLVIVVGLALPGTILRRWSGFMPTSGGRMTTEGVSRSGLGQGEALVAAKDEAFTFGPVESDLFLESTSPSLYDVASDVYGKTPPKKRKYQKAISLSADVKEAHQETTESKKGSREFSTIRETKSEQSGIPEGNDINVAFYYIGRTPQHLRMETFDSFDGSVWEHSETQSTKQAEPTVETLGNKPWIRFQHLPTEWIYPVQERMALKLIRFRSDRVATPAFASHLHIQQVDRPDFFGWTKDGQLTMVDREHIPSLTVLHQLYCVPNLATFRFNHDITPVSNPTTSENPELRSYVQLPVACDRDVLRAEVARRVGNWDRHWSTLEKLVDSIKRDCQHDPNVRAPEDCSNTVEFFLKEKKGPDYLFATTAVALLRSVEVPCRMVSGFYAGPKNYNVATGQAEIKTKDLHTWIEVLYQGSWIPIETTPGFLAPLEYRSWMAWSAEVLMNCRDFAKSNPWLCLGMSLVTMMVFAAWRKLLDGVFTSVCILAGAKDARSTIAWTLWLLKVRGFIYGNRRPKGATLRKWLSNPDISPLRTETQQVRNTFIESLQHYHYAPDSQSKAWMATHANRIRVVCFRIALELFLIKPLEKPYIDPVVPWDLSRGLRSHETDPRHGTTSVYL